MDALVQAIEVLHQQGWSFTSGVLDFGPPMDCPLCHGGASGHESDCPVIVAADAWSTLAYGPAVVPPADAPSLEA